MNPNNNNFSNNYPLLSNNKFSQSGNEEKSSHVKLFTEYKNTNNNELPDYFRISELKSNPQTYKSKYIENPYTYESILNSQDFSKNKIKEVDNFKKDVNKVKQLSKIDIATFSDINFEEKRNRLNNYKPKEERYPNDYIANVITDYLIQKQKNKSYRIKDKLKYNNNIINVGSSNSKLKLDNKDPKIEYYYSGDADMNTNPSKNKFNLINKGKGIFDFNPKNSSYLNNYNDFDIAEGDGLLDSKNLLKLPKKKVLYTDLINDTSKELQPEDYVKPIYSKFEKNFNIIDKYGNFRIKGGQFTEFVDNNQIYIGFIKCKRDEQKEKETLKTSLESANSKPSYLNKITCKRCLPKLTNNSNYYSLKNRNSLGNLNNKLNTNCSEGIKKPNKRFNKEYFQELNNNTSYSKLKKMSKNLLEEEDTSDDEVKDNNTKNTEQQLSYNYYKNINQPNDNYDKELKRSNDSFLCKQFLNMNKSALTASNNSLLLKVRDVIDKNHLYKIKHFFVKNGVIED